MRDARAALIVKRNLAPSEVSSAHVNRRTAFQTEIDARLGFLAFAVRNSELRFTYAQLADLWSALVDGALSPTERDGFFEWLGGLLPTPGEKCAIEWAVIGTLFAEKLCGGGRASPAAPRRAMGMGEFNCFAAYFRYVNGRAVGGSEVKKLSQKKANGLFTVHDPDLDGIAELWAVALGPVTVSTSSSGGAGASGDGGGEASESERTVRANGANEANDSRESESVVNAAVTLLIDLHLQLGATMETEQKHAVWRSFIEACMTRSALASRVAAERDGDGAHAEQLAGRAMTLLTRFLRCVTVDPIGLGNSLPHNPKVGVHWGAWSDAKRSLAEDVRKVTLEGEARFYAFVKATETFGSLRDRIAADAGVNPQRVSMSADWANSYGTEYTVSKYDGALLTSEYASIKATLHPAPTADLRAHVATLEVPVKRSAEEKEFVRQILSGEPRYFTQVRLLLQFFCLFHFYQFYDSSRVILFQFFYSRTYFTQLFELLAMNAPAVVDAAWSLLMDLPTDRALNQAIDAALDVGRGERFGSSAVEWSAVLDSGSPLKLLYSLQILARKFETHGAPGDAARASFCARGGLAHLRTLLAASGDGGVAVSAFFATPLSTSSLALLLRLVNELRGGAAGVATDAGRAEESRAEAARLLSSMLQLLRACSLQSGARR